MKAVLICGKDQRISAKKDVNVSRGKIAEKRIVDVGCQVGSYQRKELARISEKVKELVLKYEKSYRTI